MADYPAARVDFLDDQLQTGLGRLVDAGYQGGVEPYDHVVGDYESTEALDWTAPLGASFSRNAAPAPRVSQNFGSALLPTGPETDWFDHVFVIPGSISAGIVLASKVFTLTVYNSYKDQNRTLNSLVNGPGAGVVITGVPSLPDTIEAQSGFDVTVTVTVDGTPVITGDIDFGFDTVTISVPVTGQRTILFPHVPEAPVDEVLIFATDVRVNRNGKEQRAALREVPRSRLEYTFRVDGAERRVMENKLLDSQSRTFGLPMWQEASILQADAAINDTTITVDSTDFSHMKVGGLAMVFDEFDNFEALQVDSFTSTTITFQTGLTKPFIAGTQILPVRLGIILSGTLRGQRYIQNVQDHRIVFVTTDNDVDFSDTSAFSSYDGKVLFDDDNFVVDGVNIREGMEKSVTVVDSISGGVRIFSEYDFSRRTHPKGFFSSTRQRAWEIRQVLYALRGRHVSFYIPTFFQDLVPTLGISSGGNTLTFENVGYNAFVDGQRPRDVVRLTLDDGTKIVREIASSNEIDEDSEQITISTTWGSDASASEIVKIDFVERSRFSSDEIRMRHLNSLGQMEVQAPVITILE